jgi:hypothetical protein
MNYRTGRGALSRPPADVANTGMPAVLITMLLITTMVIIIMVS